MRRLELTLMTLPVLTLLALAPAAIEARDWKLNPGSFAHNYIKVVYGNEDWLVHSTGAYPAKVAETRKKAGYLPDYREVDDMEQTVLEMREAGFVMIGYAAVNTRERGDVDCDAKALDPNELAGCRLGSWIAGDNPDDDPLGNPVDAGIWANASVVVLQKNYSFSRGEVRKERIVTDEGTDTTRVSGSSDGGYQQQSTSTTAGTSTVSGSAATTGDWDEGGQRVGAEIGTEFGKPKGGISGGADQRKGSNRSNTTYNETGTYQSATAGQVTGKTFQDYDSNVEHQTKHWATALVEKAVDHYDLMVTFWKKVDPRKITLGVVTEPAPRDLWSVLKTRQARVVSAVTGGTPAYAAEIWKGDVLLAMNGEPIRGEQGLSDLLSRHRGQEVALTVWREGEVFDVPVKLNNPTAQ